MSKLWKRSLSLSLAAMLILSATLPGFANVTNANGHWATQVIEKWKSAGVVKGYQNGDFRPDASVTRAEYASVLNQVFKFQQTSPIGYQDVRTKDWYYEAVSKAAAAGLYIKNSGQFKPNEAITRKEVISGLAIALKVDEPSALAAYKNLNQKVTRAELVQLVDHFAGELKSVAGTYSGDFAGTVVINAANVNLKNSTIKGDLVIAQGVGNGEVSLDNLTIHGRMLVMGGGENSILVNNTKLLKSLLVDKADGKIRIVASGNTEIQQADMKSGGKLEEKNVSGLGFGKVNVLEAKTDQSVKLNGDFSSLEVIAAKSNIQLLEGKVAQMNVAAAAQGTNLDIQKAVVEALSLKAATNMNLDAKAVVKLLTADAVVTQKGSGAIDTAKINVKDVVLATQPKVVGLANGIQSVIGGKQTNSSSINVSGSTSPSTPASSGTSTNNSGKYVDKETPKMPEVRIDTATGLQGPMNSLFTRNASNQLVLALTTAQGTSKTAPAEFKGPTATPLVINQDVVVQLGENEYAKLKNLVIKGNLTIEGKNGKEGTLTLDQVKVLKNGDTSDVVGAKSGNIIVKSIASNSLHLENGVTAASVIVSDGDARLDIKSADIGHLEVSNPNSSNIRLEVSDNAKIDELLVKSNKVEIVDQTTANKSVAQLIGYVQADDVKLADIKVGAAGETLYSVGKTVNTEEKFKAKLAEINSLYKSSNGITQTDLLNWTSERMRLLVENIADMEIKFMDGGVEKTFILSDEYKNFSKEFRNKVGKTMIATIRDEYKNNVTNLADLYNITNERIRFVVRETEIQKFMGRNAFGPPQEIDVRQYEVGSEVPEVALKLKPGVAPFNTNYYTAKVTGSTSELLQYFNNKIYLMKDYSDNYRGRINAETWINVASAPTCPEAFKAGSTNTNLQFSLVNYRYLDPQKNIQEIDFAKDATGEYHIQVKGINIAPTDMKFKIEGVNLTSNGAISTSGAAVVYPNAPDYYDIIDYTVSSDSAIVLNGLMNKNEVVLKSSFEVGGETYNYVKRFNLTDIRKVTDYYQLEIVKGYVSGELKIKALDKASDYSETNQKYVLKMKLKSFKTGQSVNLSQYATRGLFATVYSDVVQTPAIECYDAEIVGDTIEIPMKIMRAPDAGENVRMESGDDENEGYVYNLNCPINFAE